MLLEVSIKPEHFAVVFEPRGLDARNVIVLRGLPGFLEAEVVERLGHLINEILIDFLFEELSLLLLRAVHEIELLGFMVALLVGIMEDVAWQERHLFWNIHLHLLLKLYFYLYKTRDKGLALRPPYHHFFEPFYSFSSNRSLLNCSYFVIRALLDSQMEPAMSSSSKMK